MHNHLRRGGTFQGHSLFSFSFLLVLTSLQRLGQDNTDKLANDELWALSTKVIPLKIIGQCLHFFSLSVLILWIHTYVSILWRNLHQKVQSECVFFPILRRNPETSSHTRQERGSESVLLGHAPAEMQPSPVSAEGDNNWQRDCLSIISSSKAANMIVFIKKVGRHPSTWFWNSFEIYVLGSGWHMRTLIQSSAYALLVLVPSGILPTRAANGSVNFPSLI